MIRTLYFICIIFVIYINMYILANINSESSRVIFSFFFFFFFFVVVVVFIRWVKHFYTPANFVTV